jgi:hypothetical protein
MVMIIGCGCGMFLQFISLVLFVSPAMSVGSGPSYFIFFLFLFAAYSISFGKVLAFETPKVVRRVWSCRLWIRHLLHRLPRAQVRRTMLQTSLKHFRSKRLLQPTETVMYNKCSCTNNDNQ